MSEPIHYPDPPTRIVEPVVSPETAVPTNIGDCGCLPAGCTVSEAGAVLAGAARKSRAKAKAEPEPEEAES